jgi:hypothetical protein
MQDFKVIDSAVSVEKLRLRLKDSELEQYGDPLTPEYVYEVIKRLPRFDNMKVSLLRGRLGASADRREARPTRRR